MAGAPVQGPGCWCWRLDTCTNFCFRQVSHTTVIGRWHSGWVTRSGGRLLVQAPRHLYIFFWTSVTYECHRAPVRWLGTPFGGGAGYWYGACDTRPFFSVRVRNPCGYALVLFFQSESLGALPCGPLAICQLLSTLDSWAPFHVRKSRLGSRADLPFDAGLLGPSTIRHRDRGVKVV